MDVEFVVTENNVEHMLMLIEDRISSTQLSEWMRTDGYNWLVNRTRDRFKSEGDEVSGKWAPLKPYTQQVRQDDGYGAAHPINRRTGDMEDFLTGAHVGLLGSGGGSTTFIYPAEQPSAETRKKLQTAQYGKSLPNTVKRPVLGIGPRDAEFFLLSLRFWIEDGVL